MKTSHIQVGCPSQGVMSASTVFLRWARRDWGVTGGSDVPGRHENARQKPRFAPRSCRVSAFAAPDRETLGFRTDDQTLPAEGQGGLLPRIDLQYPGRLRHAGEKHVNPAPGGARPDRRVRAS
ncbi:hypothetical protein GCM10008937_09810 [Deinococcus depolymerans]|uniref:Uncharacterized protein n=1 Tax=Deinococcus depolymerans TaxID=392408 RepID=A0ABP3LN85_9DEIO